MKNCFHSIPRLIAVIMPFIFLAFLAEFFSIRSVEASENFPHYDLSVSFGIKDNLIKGVSTVTLTEGKEISISTGMLKIMSVKLNGQPFDPGIRNGVFRVDVKGTLEIAYEGVFKEENIKENPENAGVVSRNIVSEEGIYLAGGWYPSIEGMAYYSLKAVIPEGFVAISEADEINVRNTALGKEYSFNFPHPVNNINLVAGKYTELKETFNDIDIYGYFFSDDVKLAETYIEFTKKYLKMYEDLLGPYPFKRFSVVENFLPTGYSMPTFTLLGQEVIKLPFIVRTSLGHEILHQWFGNFIYVDYEGGNWSEGLTTYLSDYLYEEQEGRGGEYRKKIMADYESYVTPEKEISLRDFTGRFDFASKAIGYGKGTMLFHMLKNLIGDDTFYGALKGLLKERAFKETSWDDIKTAFEKASGRKLDGFFEQWLNRKTLISIEIKDPRVTVLKGIPTVSFEILQEVEPYEFNLPLMITTGKEEITEMLHIKDEKTTFEIPVKGNPLELILDGDYDLMRVLSKEEYSPLISRLLGDERRLVVVPEKGAEKYESLVDVFKGEGFVIKGEKEIREEDIMTSSLLVLGFDSPILKRLFGKVEKPGPGFVLTVKENPINTSKVVAVAYGDSKKEVDLVSKKIFHYGRYSLVRFEKGKNTEKEILETKRGIRVKLFEPVLVIQPKETIKLDGEIDNIINKTIIYIGEMHDSYQDHKIQLKVIMDMYDDGRKFAIGMEMFQRPFQKVVNEYLSGSIGEKDFLKRSEYFRRWEFDYNLYREIVEFAKAKNIPVIALNLSSEIIEKVADGGLDALTDEERKDIPEDMDMSDKDYRKRLEKIFEEHEHLGRRNFEYFYQSQILWDETMAHSIDEFLREKPDYQIVVLAGVGHVMYGSGIPKRTYRLNSKDYVTLVPDSGTFDDDVADFVFFNEKMLLPPALKLGVILKEEDGRIKIEEVRTGSVAEKAGLKEGDILISMDDWKIDKIEDARIFLVDKKEGETVKIKIMRKKFLFGEKEIEITATF